MNPLSNGGKFEKVFGPLVKCVGRYNDNVKRMRRENRLSKQSQRFELFGRAKFERSRSPPPAEWTLYGAASCRRWRPPPPSGVPLFPYQFLLAPAAQQKWTMNGQRKRISSVEM